MNLDGERHLSSAKNWDFDQREMKLGAFIHASRLPKKVSRIFLYSFLALYPPLSL
jgi:hypothetical protein